MNNARLNKTSYTIGDEIQIVVDFDSNQNLLDDVENVSVDISSIERERNNFAFAFGCPLEISEGAITICKDLPNTFSEGLYLVSGIKLIKKGDQEGNVIPIVIKDISKLFFWFSKEGNTNLSELGLTEKINKFNLERGRYTNMPILTDASKDQSPVSSFRVMIFGVGCLIHSVQIMEGYILYPLESGYKYNHMLDAVNSYTTKTYGIKLDNNESIAKSFSSSTPLFVIDFKNVQAINHSDAGEHCSQQSENVYTILAYDRGQRPNSFATVIVDTKTGQIWQAFHFPGYRGNLVSDFNPASTAQTLENFLPKLNSSSWIDLIMRIYADAKSETNPYYACLKFWSILEIISKKKISNNTITLLRPNGDTIYNNEGKAVKTKYALGKAYKYALDSMIPPSIICGGQNMIFETYKDAKTDPNYNCSTKIIPLWELLSALYEIRNATAHSGSFNASTAKNGKKREKLAAELWTLEHQTFLQEIKNMMKTLISKELNIA